MSDCYQRSLISQITNTDHLKTNADECWIYAWSVLVKRRGLAIAGKKIILQNRRVNPLIPSTRKPKIDPEIRDQKAAFSDFHRFLILLSR